ncbi:unnamed protein product [Symbiodinium microadriaticum]|nr:unnamed protein product [Symbiodinium microadriaticum]
MQLQEYSRRVQAAESLCSFFANHNVDDASLLATAAIFRVVACPRTIQALVDLAFPRIMKKPVDKTCECFRHKLPWLLAVVARAAPADLKLWCDENVGVRRLLSSSISGFSREGAVWALDILIAMCGRVSKSVLNEFLSRTPCALVWQVSQLVRHEWHSIAFVGIFCTMLLPAAAPTMVVWVSNRMPPPLSSLPWHNSQSHAVAGPLSAERQLAELAFDIVLEISLRGGGTLDSSHALADDVRMHLFNVFLAAAGLDAALALLGSSVYDAKRFALHRDKVATIANLLCDSLQAVCGKLETASAQDVLASQASGAVDLLAGILTGPVRSLIGSDDSRPVAGDASSTCDLHSVLRTTGCTAVTLLEEVVFRWPHCLQPLPDNRVDDGRRDARGMQALVVVHEFLLNSKDLGRFLVRLFLRAFLQVEGCAHVASPKQVSSGISVDTLIAIDAEVSLCTGHVPKAALTDSSVVFDDEMKNWVAALLETELCFPAFCFFLASCSWSVANATLECMVVNSSRLAQTGTNLSVCPPRPVRQVASLLHLAAARFGRLSDSSALPELHFHDLVVQLLLAQSPGKPWMQGSQSDSSMLAEVFAYLWGIGQVSFWYTVPLAMDLRREVARALSVLLDNRDTVQAIALSEDNASCLGVLRQVLRNAPGSFPLFTSTQPGASDASVFDLLSETWTPPGRVLLAALVRLWQISDHTSDGCGLETLARLLSPVLRASTYLIAVCPRPADLFSGSDDVKTVLRVAVQLVMSPPAMSDASPNDWQRLGGELMVPLLHRPPVVEMLNDPVDQVLCDIKGGIEALTWCASYTLSGAGLPGSWGSKARSLLSFVSAQSSQTAPSPPERSCSEVARGNAVDAGFSESNSTEEDDATAAAVQARNLQEELSALNAELGALDLELAETSSQGERDCGSPEALGHEGDGDTGDDRQLCGLSQGSSDFVNSLLHGESYAHLRDALLSELLSSNECEQSFVDFKAAGGVAGITAREVLKSLRQRRGTYNLGDMAASAAQQGLIDGESLVLVLLSHAQLRLRNDRVLRALEAALFELLRQSRATAECLSSSLLSLAEMHVEGCLPQDLDDSSSQSGSRAELIDGAARVALEHLSFFTLPQMCKLLKAFMCFRMRGDRQVSALLLGIGDALGRQPNALTAGDCACAAKAFAVVRVHHERMFATLAGRLRDKDIRGGLTPAELSDVLYGFAKFTSQDTALLDLLSVQVRRHLHALDVSLMSSTLASLAKAGISCPVLTGRAVQMLRRPTVTTAAESQEVTHRHLCDLTQATTAELSALTMAFGKFQVRDSQLYETLADLFMASKSESSDTRAIAILDSPSLINIIHAFAKVHIAPARLFSAILGSLVARPEEELTTRDAVKLLHALAKVDYEMPLGFRQKILRVLGPGGLGELGVFELLKLAAASRKLGVDIDALETQVGAVLPNEPQSLTRESLQRRPAVKKVRRKSARKQKWTW